MRLAEFIREHMEAILAEWEAFAATLLPAAGGMTPLALRDHAQQILEAVAKDLATTQTRDEQSEKSKGRAPKVEGAPETAAQTHAVLRARGGFDINQLVAEYRALRASVLRLWTDAVPFDKAGVDDITRFNEAIDQAVAESVGHFHAQVERARNLFLGMLGHDMRNPLCAIQVTASFLSALNAGEQVSAAADRLIQSGKAMQALLDDLMDFNRTRLGLGIRVTPSDIDLAVPVADEVEQFRGAHPGRRIDLVVTGDCGGRWDGLRVQQSLRNLVANALKYGAADSPVRVSLRGEEADVRMEVTNSGPPIDPPAVNDLFDPLKRGAARGEGDDRSNLGLGLFIVREIARAHGGEVEVRSDGGGTPSPCACRASGPRRPEWHSCGARHPSRSAMPATARCVPVPFPIPSAAPLPRRCGMVRFLSLVAVFLVSSAFAAEKPNIVLLLADDMGYGDLGVQNPDSKIPTPHLDKLAKAGTRFTDAHSSSGVCTPSRYALLHGRYHWRKFHGIVNSFDQTVLDKDRTTLAQLLKANGYRTACVGKWHLGWDWKAIQKPGTKPGTQGYAADAFDWSKRIPGGPLDFGFDHYFGDDVPNFPPYTWFEDDRVLAAPTGPLATVGKPAEGAWEARPGPSVKDWDFHAVMPKLTEKAVEWIGKQKAGEPFFLYFPFTSPHAPIVPSKEFAGTTKANGYGDYMAQTDAAVGAVIAALAKHGFDKNTLVVFTSDNGPERYAYDRVKNHDHRSMGPLRGLKRDLWEGGHRVPFVAAWPGHVPANAVSDGLLGHTDLYATVAAVIGAETPAKSGEDGVNQLPLFLGKGKSGRDTLVHNTNANGYAIRHGDWVLIDAKTGGVSAVPGWYDEKQGYKPHAQPGELYNLKDDLAQKVNRYADNPEKVAELKKKLADVRKPAR